jgi:hypothetical protein
MKIADFAALPANEQKEVLRKKAVYLAKRKDQHSVFFLFQMEDFYVEISFHAGRNKVGRCRCFRSMRLLDPYLEQMVVKHLS